MVSRRSIRFTTAATNNLESALRYIRKDSVANAKKVKHDIIQTIRGLVAYPEKYPLDKNKINNDSTYRAFEIHHYRVAYRILELEIRIIMIRHTSMEPLEY